MRAGGGGERRDGDHRAGDPGAAAERPDDPEALRGASCAAGVAARAAGFIIRAGAGWGYPSFLRISLGTPEQNAAITRAILAGSSLCIPVDAGQLKLGCWQGIYLCEYDGPRTRKIQLTFLTEQ